jgi:dienelactone hydrolase
MGWRTTITLLVCLLWAVPVLAEDITVPVEWKGQQIQLTGRFWKPQAAGPSPVVIMEHACNGMYDFASSRPAWAALFQQQGYATLELDSFTGRGISNDCGIWAVSPGDRGHDAMAAAYVLAERLDVRGDRIAMIGWSHGGNGAIHAARDFPSNQPLREQLASRRGKLAASASLYPGGCTNPEHGRAIVPLLVLAGSQDDFSDGGASCVAMAKAQQENSLLTVKIYPGVYHGFDNPGIAGYSWIGHMIKYDAAAIADARARVSEFFRKYLQ